jgi:hypothetical protein
MKAAGRLLMAASKAANHAAFVQSVGTAQSGQTSGTTLTLTVPAGGVPLGHTLVLRGASDFISSGPTGSDTRGNTWTLVRSSPGSGSTMRGTLLACQVTTALQAGDTITATWGSALVNRAIAVDEFSGLLTPLTVDAQNGASGTSTAPDANVTTTTSVDLVVGMVASVNSVTDTYTQDSAWNALSRVGTSPGTAPYINVGGAYLKATHTNVWHYKPTFGTSAVWVAIAAAFKAT